MGMSGAGREGGVNYFNCDQTHLHLTSSRVLGGKKYNLLDCARAKGMSPRVQNISSVTP